MEATNGTDSSRTALFSVRTLLLCAFLIAQLAIGNASATSFLSPCCNPKSLNTPITVGEGVRVAWGDLGAPLGTPLLVMGTLEDYPYISPYFAIWDGYMKEKNVRLIFMETPGMFREETLQNPTMAQVSDIAAQFMTALAYPTFAIYAHSSQGQQALDMASRHPNRITKLFLNHTRGEMTPELIYNTTPPTLPPIEPYLFACPEVPDCLAQMLNMELSSSWKSFIQPQEASTLGRVPGMDSYLDIVWSTVSEMRVPYAVQYLGSVIRDPIDVESIAAPVYAYNASQDYLFPPPYIYSTDLQSRISGPAINLVFDGEMHFDSITRHFDQVVLDASGADEVIYCQNNTTVSAPRSYVPIGAALGNCFWTRPTYAVQGRSVSARIGLKNSDAVGLRIDIRAELLLGGKVLSAGEVRNVSAGSSGFQNALLHSLALGPATGTLSNNENLRVRLSARRTCYGGGHNSGVVRFWFDHADANSLVRVGLNNNSPDVLYYMRYGGALQSAAGDQMKYIDISLNSSSACPSRTFTPFGEWNVLLQ